MPGLGRYGYGLLSVTSDTKATWTMNFQTQTSPSTEAMGFVEITGGPDSEKNIEILNPYPKEQAKTATDDSAAVAAAGRGATPRRTASEPGPENGARERPAGRLCKMPGVDLWLAPFCMMFCSGGLA